MNLYANHHSFSAFILLVHYYVPASVGRGHYKLPSVVCSSVCGVPRHNSRKERPRKPKIGRMEAHHMGIQWTYLEVKRSKVKVTRPINAQTVNVQYLPKGKDYELQTWDRDGARRRDPHQRQAPWPSRSKVMVARSRDASDRCWLISRERNVLETPKLVERFTPHGQ